MGGQLPTQSIIRSVAPGYIGFLFGGTWEEEDPNMELFFPGVLVVELGVLPIFFFYNGEKACMGGPWAGFFKFAVKRASKQDKKVHIILVSKQ